MLLIGLQKQERSSRAAARSPSPGRAAARWGRQQQREENAGVSGRSDFSAQHKGEGKSTGITKEIMSDIHLILEPPTEGAFPRSAARSACRIPVLRAAGPSPGQPAPRQRCRPAERQPQLCGRSAAPTLYTRELSELTETLIIYIKY